MPAPTKLTRDIANTRITRWATRVRGELVTEIARLGIKHASASPSPQAAINSITQKLRKNKEGGINRVGYVIPRHMIYVHKGVGRGTPIERVGTTRRKPKPWFNPVVERRIDELANIVAEETGDLLINNLLIK